MSIPSESIDQTNYHGEDDTQTISEFQKYKQEAARNIHYRPPLRATSNGKKGLGVVDSGFAKHRLKQIKKDTGSNFEVETTDIKILSDYLFADTMASRKNSPPFNKT